MNFELKEEHLMIRDAAREFAQAELAHDVIERDEQSKFPYAQVKNDGRIGIPRHDGLPRIRWRRHGHRFLRARNGGNGQGRCFGSRDHERLQFVGQLGPRSLRHGSTKAKIPRAPCHRRKNRRLLPQRT
jgi:hypothetical protein